MQDLQSLHCCDGGFTQTWDTVGAGKLPMPRELDQEERTAPLWSEVLGYMGHNVPARRQEENILIAKKRLFLLNPSTFKIQNAFSQK